MAWTTPGNCDHLNTSVEFQHDILHQWPFLHTLFGAFAAPCDHDSREV